MRLVDVDTLKFRPSVIKTFHPSYTCYIDRKSSANLREAINSMFNCYAVVMVCYVYLSDVASELERVTLTDKIREAFGQSIIS